VTRRPSKGEYAAALVPYAARLVDLVHDEGGAVDVGRLFATVARLPRPAGVESLAGLAVVLAALVPAAVDVEEALAWITWEWTEAVA
jgi:hypothetical protein